ncbi:MAG: hypothetical protein QM754_13855 [Tepidisphaeraceae bacterium]
MNRRDEFQAGFFGFGGVLGARAVVADGDHHAADFLVAELIEQVRPAEHGDVVDVRAVQLRGGVQEADDAVPAFLSDGVQDDFAVPAGTDQHDVHKSYRPAAGGGRLRQKLPAIRRPPIAVP